MPPASALVVLVGPAGAGKSTFAAAHFRPTEIVSSDFCRALVADDMGDQTASPQAFALLRFIAVRRLRRGRLTVIDATNLRRQDRAAYLAMAARWRRPAVAVVFDLPLQLCLDRNRQRPRTVDEAVVADQWRQLPRPPDRLLKEGFSAVLSPTEWGSPAEGREGGGPAVIPVPPPPSPPGGATSPLRREETGPAG
jgi:protein phosphatase